MLVKVCGRWIPTELEISPFGVTIGRIGFLTTGDYSLVNASLTGGLSA